MTAVPVDVSKLEAALEKATPGPWHVAKTGGIDAGQYDTVISGGPVECMAYCYGGSSTLEGDHLADVGDYVIRGVQGEFYPCKPDIFAATYEATS